MSVSCDICGNDQEPLHRSGSHTVCDFCKTKLRNHIAQKCLNCGAYGFVPCTPVNVSRVMQFIPLTEIEVVVGDIVVVWSDCPNCGGIEKRQHTISTFFRS